MSDDELDQLLQRYRVADPPLRLRAAVITGRVRLRPVDWILAAAASVLVAGVVLTRGGGSTEVDARAAFAGQVEAIAASLGGGPDAVAIALMTMPAPAAPGAVGGEDQ